MARQSCFRMMSMPVTFPVFGPVRLLLLEHAQSLMLKESMPTRTDLRISSTSVYAKTAD